MRYITNYIIGILLLTSCVHTENKILEIDSTIERKTVTPTNSHKKSDVNSGFSIINTGPRGGRYISSKGTDFRYTVFRVQIINDTVVPINLSLKFPPKSIWLLPDSTIELKVFLIPEKFTEDSITDTINLGVRMEEFFESGVNQQLDLNTSIHPEKPLTVFIGVLMDPKQINGITRTKLFVEGHDNDRPYYSVKSVESYDINTDSINLQYGISFDPPNYYITIPCGKIQIK
jgi:hypothetical protein